MLLSDFLVAIFGESATDQYGIIMSIGGIGHIAFRFLERVSMSEQQFFPVDHAPLKVPGYLSVRAAAEMLGICERSVLELIERKRLASARLGRMHFIPTREVHAYGVERRLRQRRSRHRIRRRVA